MRFMGALAAAAIVVIAAGCNGDAGAGEITTTTEQAASTTSAPDVTPTTTSPPPSTTQATSPTTETSTSPTTQPTTTSQVPDTTLDPDDRAANTLAIIETVERSFAVYNAALSDPFDDERAAALNAVFTPRLVEGWMNIIEDYRENNFRSVPNPDAPARYVVDVNSVEVNLENGTALVQACHLNTFVKVEVGGNPDGTDRIVENEITEQTEQLELVREDGIWKINAASLPDETQVVTPCG